MTVSASSPNSCRAAFPSALAAVAATRMPMSSTLGTLVAAPLGIVVGRSQRWLVLWLASWYRKNGRRATSSMAGSIGAHFLNQKRQKRHTFMYFCAKTSHFRTHESESKNVHERTKTHQNRLFCFVFGLRLLCVCCVRLLCVCVTLPKSDASNKASLPVASASINIAAMLPVF